MHGSKSNISTNSATAFLTTFLDNMMHIKLEEHIFLEAYWQILTSVQTPMLSHHLGGVTMKLKKGGKVHQLVAILTTLWRPPHTTDLPTPNWSTYDILDNTCHHEDMAPTFLKFGGPYMRTRGSSAMVVLKDRLDNAKRHDREGSHHQPDGELLPPL